MSYLKSKDGSIEASIKEMQKNLNDNAYQKLFKKELEKAGKGIGAMTPAEKKAFFNKIDSKYSAKNEGLEEIEKEIQEALGYGAKYNKVYVKRNGSDFEVFYRGRTKYGTNKQIGYFHRIPGGKLSVYHDNENDKDDFTQNDLGYTVQKAIGIIFDTADDNGVIKEAKVDELTSAQKKLPPALQKAIKDKEDKKESVDGEINQKKHDSYNDPKKGEKKPVVTQEEESFDVEKLKEDVNTLWSNAAKDLEEMKKNSKYMKAQDVAPNNDADGESEKTKGKTLVGSAKTKVETEPKVDYQK